MTKKDKMQDFEVTEAPTISEEEAAALEAQKQERLAQLLKDEIVLKEELAVIAKERKELTGKSAVIRGPRGVGASVKEWIKEGKTNPEILELVKEHFPQNVTNTNCINWYRNALKLYPDTNGVKPRAPKVVEEVSEEVEDVDQEPSKEAFYN